MNRDEIVKEVAGWVIKDMSHGWSLEDSLRDHMASLDFSVRVELGDE